MWVVGEEGDAEAGVGDVDEGLGGWGVGLAFVGAGADGGEDAVGGGGGDVEI